MKLTEEETLRVIRAAEEAKDGNNRILFFGTACLHNGGILQELHITDACAWQAAITASADRAKDLYFKGLDAMIGHMNPFQDSHNSPKL